MAVIQPDHTQTTTGPAQLIAPILATYRRRIRRERRRWYVSSALVAVGTLWLLAALLHYSDLSPSFLLPLCLVLSILLIIAAFTCEALRQPSIADTARALDRRLDNQQRLVTSIELMENTGPKDISAIRNPQSAVCKVQLSTTAQLLARANPKSVYPVRTPWPSLLVSGGLLMLAMGIFALKGLPGDFTPLKPLGLPDSQQAASILASPTSQSGLPNAEKPQITPTAQQTQQADTSAQAQSGTQTGSDSSNSAANTVDPSKQAASQDSQKGLDRLGQALGEQSVTQQASDSVKQGKYNQAAQQLAEVGRENDQLSQGAKQDLAQSLESAAQDPSLTPELHDTAQAAANALRSGDYKQTEQALRDLGDTLKQTAQNIIPQQELAKTFPEQPQGSQAQQGQNGQQPQQGPQPNPQGQQSQQGQSQQDGNQQGSQSGQQQGNQQGQTQSSQQGQTGQPGQQSSSQGQPGQQAQQGQQAPTGGQQGGQKGQGGASDLQSGDSTQQGQGSAPGQGTRVGDPVDRGDPNVAGNPFELEGQPDNGKPSKDNERPALTLEGSAASGQVAPVSPGSAVTTQGESNQLPVERWGIIQRYFGGGR